MPIFATFQILLILRVLTVFFFRIERLNVTICFMSLLLTVFYFQFCLRDIGKERTKELPLGTREWQTFFF